MIECGSLEYAQARMQARHGQRADDAAWQRLAGAREHTALLDAARSSPLRAWVVGITPHSSAHEIEAVLRGHWRAVVGEVTGRAVADMLRPVRGGATGLAAGHRLVHAYAIAAGLAAPGARRPCAPVDERRHAAARRVCGATRRPRRRTG